MLPIPSSSGFTREVFDAHATVFRAGDPGDSAYMVETGCVEVLLEADGQMRQVNVLRSGAMFGEMALLDRQPRSGTVRTLEPTVLTRIDRALFDQLLRGTDPVIQYIMRLLLERLRRQPAALAQAARAGTAAPSPAPAPAGAASLDALQAEALRTLSLSRDLSDALDANQLELHYQPIITLEGRRLAGYEALVRWRHPERGFVRPDEFIPLAERTGLIHRVGTWVFQRAVADWPALRALCDPGDTPPFVSVNLSAPELSVDGIANVVLQGLEQGGMNPRELRIELTETAVIGNLATVTRVTQDLRAAGVGIALDDFGTGYAGLSYLQDLPFSCLKIDRAFVSQMRQTDRSLHIVKLALELSRWLNMSTVAEGVEDLETAEALREMGCSHGQGWCFAKAMSVPALQAWRAQAAPGAS